MKKFATGLGIMVLVAVLSTPVFAYRGGFGKGVGHGHGPCWSYGGRIDKFTDDQRSELNKLENNFFDDTYKLRTDLWAKSDELDALLRGTEPDVKKVQALQKEVSQLRAQMAEKRTNFILDAKKIAPEVDFGRGHGRGGGFGRCENRFCEHRSGFGSGVCW